MDLRVVGRADRRRRRDPRRAGDAEPGVAREERERHEPRDAGASHGRAREVGRDEPRRERDEPHASEEVTPWPARVLQDGSAIRGLGCRAAAYQPQTQSAECASDVRKDRHQVGSAEQVDEGWRSGAAGAERDHDAAQTIEIPCQPRGDRDSRPEDDDEPGQQEGNQLH